MGDLPYGAGIAELAVQCGGADESAHIGIAGKGGFIKQLKPFSPETGGESEGTPGSQVTGAVGQVW